MKAQCTLPYKALSAFGNDTANFVLYNFMDRADQYKGKKLENVLKDFKIPINTIAVAKANGKVEGMYLYISDIYTDRMANRGLIQLPFKCIIIEWEELIPYDEQVQRLARSN